jgi:hypothetical protein
MGIQNYVVPDCADEDAWKQEGGQQAVFLSGRHIVGGAYGSDKENLAHGKRTNTQFLRRQGLERPLCHAQGAGPRSGLIQEWETAFPTGLVKEWAVAARIELQKERARTNTGDMDSQDQPHCKWQNVIRVLRADQRDALPAYLGAHAPRGVKTEHLVSVIDEHVEMSQEVFSEHSPNVGIGSVDLAKVVDDGERVLDGLKALNPLHSTRIAEYTFGHVCRWRFRPLENIRVVSRDRKGQPG